MSDLTVKPMKSARGRRRLWPVVTVLVGLSVVLAGVALSVGDYPVALEDVFTTLLGHGNAMDNFIVLGLRLPRYLAALLIGAALGASGAVFQGLTRNPLGSPDVIGFTSGAATGALVQLLVFHGGAEATAIGAITGGLATAGVVYVLSVKHRRVQTYRLVLIGIGASAALSALSTYLLTRASLTDALNAQQWLIGSLNGMSWAPIGPLVISVAVLLPTVVILSRSLAWLELGDDTAKAQGVPVEKVRAWLVVTATALCAVTTAAAGPIAFIALAAPQLCRQLLPGRGAVVGPSALMGAVLLAVGDQAAQRLVPSQPLPVGVLTGLLGGLYLCWLLARQWSRKRA